MLTKLKTNWAATKLNDNIPFVAAFLSIILSIIVNITNSNPLNIDGLFYLQAAKTYLASGWNALIGIYPWPLYILCIVWLSNLTQLSLLHSAELLDLIFYAVFIFAFVEIIKELGGSVLAQWCAAILILVYPELNTLRVYVIRDIGYWAFIFIGLWQFLRYSKKPSLSMAIVWSASMFFALLFRVEGFFVWLFMPFALLANHEISWQLRWRQFGQCYIVPAAMIVVILCYVLFWKLHQLTLTNLQSLIYRTSIFDNFRGNGINILLQQWQNINQLIGTHILNQFSVIYAPFFFVGGFFSVFIAQFLALLEPLPIVFSGYAIYKQLLPASLPQRKILYYFTLINFVIPIAWLYTHFFLSARYFMSLTVTLLLWTPFGLEALITPWKNQQNQRRFRTLLIIMTSAAILIMAVCGLYRFGHSKAYITNAGYWLAANTPNNVNLFSNSQEVMFYANRREDMWKKDYDQFESFSILQNTGWKKYDYLALRINQDDALTVQQLAKQLGTNPVKIFENDRGDEILIYKINHH